MPRSGSDVRCVERGHTSSRVRRDGFRTDDRGRRWQRFECLPPTGRLHKFQVLVDDAGAPMAPPTLPARCALHPEGHVVRNGSYGDPIRRQRYRCVPPGGQPHYFALQLPREHVGTTEIRCPDCEELIGANRGTQSSSRRAKWPTRAVIRCLQELAGGTSYATASLNVLEATAIAQQHTLSHRGLTERVRSVDAGDPKAHANAWHLAPDLMEQYAPLLCRAVEADILTRTRADREANDAAIAVGRAPDNPITYILDEIPVYVSRHGGRSQNAWTVHSVVEVTRRPGTEQRLNRLRLARALPGPATGHSWRRVLKELAVRPDFVVSDFGVAIAVALDAEWPGVAHIPSLYHFVQYMRDTAKTTDGLRSGRGKSRQVIPEFAEHLAQISRDRLVREGDRWWHTWWDELEAIAAAHGVPPVVIRSRRDNAEEAFAAAIPLLRAMPWLPASNAAVEVKNRDVLGAALDGRRSQMRNLERTNLLLDLIVAREYGILNDVERIRDLIREDNLAHGGWATPRRGYDDRQPTQLVAGDQKRRSYASLYDTSILETITADD